MNGTSHGMLDTCVGPLFLLDNFDLQAIKFIDLLITKKWLIKPRQLKAYPSFG